MLDYNTFTMRRTILTLTTLSILVLLLSFNAQFISPPEWEAETEPQVTTPTEDVLPEVVVAAPAEDASISHVVRSGENAWLIANAYDITVAQLAALNGLDADNPTLWVGQVLIIREAYTPTISPTITLTPTIPTRTPRPTFTPRPPTITPTITVTPTPTTNPLIPGLPPMKEIFTLRTIGYIIIVISGLGLVFVAITGFIIRKK